MTSGIKTVIYVDGIEEPSVGAGEGPLRDEDGA